jgi:chromosome segregation ATPase
MKNRFGVVVLVLVCIVLAVALLATRKQAAEDRHKAVEAVDKINDLSNKVVKTTSNLLDQQQVNGVLTNDISIRNVEIAVLTNKFAEMAGELEKVSTALTRSEVSLKSAQDEMAKRDARIAELEAQNATLDQRALELNRSITNLTGQIDDTKKKLAASEGDKTFLAKELKRLMAEKVELERQFNDLAILRAQVAKLKQDLTISRRLDWMRRGLSAAGEQKGAQQLIQHGPAAPATAARPAQHYDLNVEVHTDGSVKVIPPLTNSPAATNPPAPK